MKLIKKYLRQLDRKFLNSKIINYRYIKLLEKQRRSFDRKFSRTTIIKYESKKNLLAELCDKYGTDKGSNKPYDPNQAWAPHNYTDFYHDIFSRNRNTVNSLLEIGIGSNNQSIKGSFIADGIPGASLRVWKDYFPNAAIYGADIDPDSLFTEDRIITFVMDQTKDDSIASFVNLTGQVKFDIIIDDGLHEFHAGLSSFKNLFKYLKIGGIYIIEDVVLDDLISYQKFFLNSHNLVKYISMERDNRGLISIHHNSLVIIEKIYDD